MEDIKTRRETLGLTQAELAKMAGTSQPQIKRLENGERELTRSWAERLAGPLKTTPVRILFPDNDDNDQVGARLISWVSAGALLQSDLDPFAMSDDAQWAYAPDLDPNGDWIALRVDGDSMNRISPHDSIIFVNRKDKKLVPNACYVIGDGEGGATYKRYRPPTTWEPVSTNKTHKPMVLNEGAQPDIIGRVRKTVLAM